MICTEVRELLHGYADNELDVATSLKVEQHLRECASCSAAYSNIQTMHTALTDALYFEAPDSLEVSVRKQLFKEHAVVALAQTKNVGVTPRKYWTSIAFASAASIVIGVLASFFLLRQPGVDLSQELVTAHVRSLMLNHLVDVPSSDQHTVKPWFAGKIDFSPSVTDFADKGFPLIGGRLDYVDHRPVAVLAYHRNQHIINLFIWPKGNDDHSATPSAVHGYNILNWDAHGMEYWAVSDLNVAELKAFETLDEAID